MRRFFTIWLCFSLLLACKKGEEALQKGLEEAAKADIDLTGVPPERMILSPSNAVVGAGERVMFVATGVYTRDYSQVIKTGITWSSSDPTILTIDSDGKGLAINEGKALITASYLGITSSVKVFVSPAVMSQLMIFPEKNALELVLKNGQVVPQNLKLQAFALFSDGTLYEMTEDVDWQVDDNGGLKGDPDKPGRYVVQGVGNWDVKISYGGMETAKPVVVTQQPKKLVGIKASANPLVLRIGQVQSLDIIGVYSDDSEATLPDEWTLSSVSDLFTLNGRQFTGAKNGSFRTQLKSNGFAATLDIYVQDSELTGIAVSPSSFTLHQGESGTYTIIASYGDGSTADITSGATVESTNTAVMSVNTSTNKVSGLTQGSANIRVTYHGRQVNALVAVDNPVLSKLEVRPSTLRVVAGRTANFQVYGIYTNGTEADITSLVTAQALATSRAEVSSAGALLGKTNGVTVLSATYVDPITTRNLSGTAAVTVDPAELLTLIFDNTAASIALGRTFDFGVQGTYSDSTQIDVGSQIQITADVSSTGMSYVGPITRTTGNKIRVTARSMGTMKVIATLGGQTASATITVTDKQLDQVQIRRQTPYTNAGFLLKGDAADFTAIATFSDSSTQDVTTSNGIYTVTWGAPNASVASFTDVAGKKHMVGLSDGDAFFTVSVTSSQGNASASFGIGIYIPCSGTGQYHGYQCWFLGTAGNSCDTTCSAVSRATHGATISVSGSGASSNNECSNILSGLFRSSMNSFSSSATASTGVGCAIFTQSGINIGLRESTNATTGSASLANFRRVCSCE